jgi:hypothetical protein
LVCLKNPVTRHVRLPSTVRVLFSTPLHVMMHVWPGALSPHALALRPVPTVLIAGHTHLGMSADQIGE